MQRDIHPRTRKQRKPAGIPAAGRQTGPGSRPNSATDVNAGRSGELHYRFDIQSGNKDIQKQWNINNDSPSVLETCKIRRSYGARDWGPPTTLGFLGINSSLGPQ
ncbi:hypothetical protein PoB_003993000 [Plakobranchus ocellatus]|uniref:Uncharacterized protein n=1 Tax=Plakobranchus ocellatus TaxID=259542 RepID=A0AAV4B2Y4_9GAST|nr:hypothetical protein PoB_003993000 [Plakobranchus ocellatus]